MAEVDDFAGDSLEVGDFNCDGYDDLAIGVPREDLTQGSDAGAAQVLYGSAGGVSSVDDMWHEGVSGVNGVVEAGDNFGGGLAAGNFNADEVGGKGCDDLAIASPGESVGSIAEAGFLYIIDGGAGGLSTAGDQAFHQNTSGVVDVAQAYDRFGATLAVVDENDDGFEDIVVFVPGDACEAGVSTGRHVLRGSASGITTVGDHLDCYRFGCVTAPGEMICGPRPVRVFPGATSNELSLSEYSDVAITGSGSDQVLASAGNDVVLGGAGNDDISGGPGLDLLLGGPGNDTFTVSQTCHVEAGEVIDGGPGSDTVVSHMLESELVAAGVVLRSVENFVLAEEGHDACDAVFAAGRFARPPSVPASWSSLQSPSSVWSSTSGVLDLDLQNTRGVTVQASVSATLRVSGVAVNFAYPQLSIAAGTTGTVRLQSSDFIPAGVNLSKLDPAFLDLPVSATLIVRCTIEANGEVLETPVVPIVYGHVENTDTIVVYREEARDQVFFGGDLTAYRAAPSGGPNPYYLGVFESRG